MRKRGEVHERNRFLGRTACRKGQNPKEEKSQEGYGLYSAFIIRIKIQTLIREQTPKVGLVERSATSQNAFLEVESSVLGSSLQKRKLK
jgi:hypothetical protein